MPRYPRETKTTGTLDPAGPLASKSARRNTARGGLSATEDISNCPGYDPLFDVKGAAGYASCSEETIRRAVRLRELGCCRTGGPQSHIRVRLSALNAWLGGMENTARKAK